MENGLVEKGKRTNRISDIVEIIKSKLVRNYILNDKSPYSLRMNKKLVLRTIEKDFKYLDRAESELISQELEQEILPNGIIKKAFERGYIYSENTNELLKGRKGKTAIMEYLNMQEDKRKDDDIFNKTNYKVESLMEYLSEDILEDEIIDTAKKKGYQIKSTSKEHLKNRVDLALDYYRNINIDDIDRKNILSESLIANEKFLTEYFKILEDKGLSGEYILSTITKNEKFIDLLKKDSNNIEFFLKTIEPKKLEEFLKTFYSDEEIKQLLTDNDNILNGRLKRLSELYKLDPEIINSENATNTDYLIEGMDGRLLNEKYSNIPNNKLQIIARDRNLQHKLLGLSDNEYKIYSLMSANISEKTDRWNEYDYNFIQNLSSGNYKELIDNIGSSIENGDNITLPELENMIKLFSTLRTYEEHKNIFNITSKEQVANYEQIRENVCNLVIENPSLNGELPSELEEHLVSFNDMSEIDRMKLAILQKTYGMDLTQAHLMVIKYGNDIDEIIPNSDKEESIRETIMAIKGISECDDIETLKQVASLDILVKSDKALETVLSNETDKMYENLYKSQLYNPDEKDKVDTIEYNGKDISIYDAGTDFAMITKRLSTNTKNGYKKEWNDLNPIYDDMGNKGFRYRTCTSYVTPENMCVPTLIVGFSKSIENNSFDLIDSKDIHSNMYGDGVVPVVNYKKFRIPENLEMETNSSEEGGKSNYNEIVINMLSQDENGNLQKSQPDYVVYVKQKDIERENDEYWKSAMEFASEFDIPIVMLDAEKIQESEKQKIQEEIANVDNLNPSKNNKKLFKKIKHYKCRYGKEIGFDEQLEAKTKYFEDMFEDKFNESSSKSSIYLETLMQKDKNKSKSQEIKNVEEIDKNEEYGIY